MSNFNLLQNLISTFIKNDVGSFVIVYVILMMIDFSIAFIHAFINKEVKSQSIYVGAIKKMTAIVLLFLTVIFDVFANNYVGLNLGFSLTSIFNIALIISECLSIVENIDNFGFLTGKLKESFSWLESINAKKINTKQDNNTEEKNDE